MNMTDRDIHKHFQPSLSHYKNNYFYEPYFEALSYSIIRILDVFRIKINGMRFEF
jgi:hypothetical protein